MQPLRTLLALTLAAGCTLAHARLGFGWSLDDWEPEVGTGQTVVLNASLYNEASSTEALRGDRLRWAVGEGAPGSFDFADALPSLAEQLRDVVLDPGEGVNFVFGRLVPLAGTGPGSYMAGPFAIAFTDEAGAEVSWAPDRSLVVRVVDAPPAGVPEPATGLLVMAGIALAGVARRR